MRRFFVNSKEIQNAQVELRGDEFHHLKNVSRLEVGEKVELLDGEGYLALATIIEIKKSHASLSIDALKKIPPPPAPHVEIFLCVPRFQKMDLILQKSVELGASKIHPLVSEKSFVKTISTDLRQKIPRWQKIANEACKQSGRPWPLIIEEPSTLSARIEALSSGAENCLFLYEGLASLSLKKALAQFQKPPERLKVFIGAEGGFSPQEVEHFEARGVPSVSLGALVLRVETACIAILSIIQFHFDLLGR